jgi:hypothetical protein
VLRAVHRARALEEVAWLPAPAAAKARVWAALEPQLPLNQSNVKLKHSARQSLQPPFEGLLLLATDDMKSLITMRVMQASGKLVKM